MCENPIVDESWSIVKQRDPTRPRGTEWYTWVSDEMSKSSGRILPFNISKHSLD